MDIKYIKDNEGTNFFPVAHEKGIIDNNGTTLESKIGTLNDAMSSKADKATTYTKAEVNNLIPSADNDTQIVSTLPTTGTANTIYRVPGATSYQDYAWDGSDWVLLGTFSGNVNDGYTYMGVATTSTTPDTSDPNVYYIAGEAGTYTNFNNLQHTGGIGIFKWDGSAWSYDNAAIVTDATPTEGSTNPVQSGGVYNEIAVTQYINLPYQTASGLRLVNPIITVSSESIYYVPISAGETIKYKMVYTAGYLRSGFTSNIPAKNGSAITNAAQSVATGSGVEFSYTAESNGYLCVCQTVANITSISFYKEANTIGHDVYVLKNQVENADLQGMSESVRLFKGAFIETNVSIEPETEKYQVYSTGGINTAGARSKMEIISIPLNGEFFIGAYVACGDSVPSAIAFYNSTTPSTSSYLKSASVQIEANGGKWYYAPVPEGAALAIVTNKYGLLATPIIKTLSVANITNSVSTSIKKSINESSYLYSPFTNAPFYSHHVPTNFIKSANNEKLIAGESIESIAFAARLGYKFVEANVHLTSDGEYVVMHGESGKFGTQVIATNGDDIASVNISSKSLSYIQSYVRFNSDWDKYRTPVATLDEWLDACAENGIGCFLGSTDSGAIEKCINKLGQDRVILYDAPVSARQYFGGIMLWWNNSSGLTIDGIIQASKNYGRPFIYSIGPTVINEFKTQGILEEFVETMHENGFLCGFASVYQTEAETSELLNLGFDFSGSGAEVNYFEGGTIYDINNPTNFTNTGSISNGIITLANDNIIVCGDSDDIVGLGKCYLRIKFNGAITVKMGSRTTRSFTSNGNGYMVLSDYSMMRTLQLVIRATASTTIYDFVYKVIEC